MHHADTLKALSSNTDTGLFERLATAVLRESNPLYESIIHTGVNVDGKTVKGPVDGITFLKGANPPHMISVHHTTGDRDKLEKKWLFDSSTVKSKKNIKYGDGDILKTIKIYKAERIKESDLIGTLILTITSDPSEELIRKSEQIARDAGIEIDFWSASRIAHFLDTDPNGQYIRKQYLHITQERISKKLLHDLSQQSISTFTLPNEEFWIERDLDKKLNNLSKSSGVTIVLGESGEGKSVSCYKYLTQHISSGGYGFILNDAILHQSHSIEQAIQKTLLSFYPSLMDNSGIEALNLSSSSMPMLLVIEDINTSGKAKLLLEKIISWHKQKSDNKTNISWQILCPVYPKFITELDKETIKILNSQIINCSVFSIEEGTKAIAKRYKLASKEITSFKAKEISTSLGNDPLLIALYNLDEQPKSSNVIKEFINNKLIQLSHKHEEFVTSEYLETLLIFIFKILDNRIIQPKWSDIEIFELSTEQRKMLRQIAHQGDIFRLIGNIEEQTITFRHDRVYSWLASTSIAKKLSLGKVSDSFLSEPYFSEIIGLSLNKPNITLEIVNLIKLNNPLALFYALQEFSVANSAIEKAILFSIKEWSHEKNTHSKSNEYLRLECVNCLSETDSPHILEILKNFKNEGYSYDRAGFRNGDIEKGFQLCIDTNPGVNYPFQEQLIQYVISKYRKELIQTINSLLKRTDLDQYYRSGILRLCGYIADNELFDSLKFAWENQSTDSRMQILDDYFWANSHCCGDSPSILLDPIFDAWASLSDKSESNGMGTPRESFAAHEIRFAFQKYVPIKAIEYFITQTKRSELEWPITFMLHGIDHPSAVIYMAHYFAKKEKEIEGTTYFNHFLSTSYEIWERRQDVDKKIMSKESRNELYKLWSDVKLDKYLRLQSFKLWSATHVETDISILESFQNDEILSDAILIQRIKRDDSNALSLLATKIRETDKTSYWWQFARNLWSDELTTLLDEELSKRLIKEKNDVQDDSDWIISELIMKLPTSTAESILLKHWEYIKENYLFIQSALYIATDKLVNLVGDAVTNCSEPQKMFTHLCMHYGINHNNRKGITKLKQLEVLLPYIDYLKEMDLYSFAEECNKRGWFDFRKKHLDIRLKETKFKNIEYLYTENIIKSLNTMIEKNSTWHIHHWVDDFLQTGASSDDVMNSILKWIKSKDEINITIINLALDVLLQIGNKEYYYQLLEICNHVKDEYMENFNNALYLLRRRH